MFCKMDLDAVKELHDSFLVLLFLFAQLIKVTKRVVLSDCIQIVVVDKASKLTLVVCHGRWECVGIPVENQEVP